MPEPFRRPLERANIQSISKNMKYRKKAAVIGAGLGGMALALRLAAKGWEVCICERSSSPGGKMNRWTAEGFTWGDLR